MKHNPNPDRLVDLDVALESRIFDVESAVVAYLVRITDETCGALVAAIGALDEESSASDAFRSRRSSIATSASLSGLGTSSLDVIGQTSRFPIVREEPLLLFQAQVSLVRAARAEALAPTPQTLDALSEANREVAEIRSRLHAEAWEDPGHEPPFDEPSADEPSGDESD